MLPTIYNSQLSKLDLPDTGFNSPLRNWYDILSYMGKMTEDQKVVYLQLLASESYKSGIATGEQNLEEN
jgi:hypothetical protein